MRATLLHAKDLSQILGLLHVDVRTNLFLLGQLQNWELGRRAGNRWWGALDEDDGLHGVCFSGNRSVDGGAGLLVPFGSSEAMTLLGTAVGTPQGGVMCVGPRHASDALWAGIGEPECQVRTDQRLFVCTAVDQGEHLEVRKAGASDVGWVAHAAAEMMKEDLGIDPRGAVHQRRVNASVLAGRTWIGEQQGRPVFKVEVGTDCEHGAQLGGTWVDPASRGAGIGTRGMRAVAASLLEHRPLLTLHVREDNRPAIRCYESVGFKPSTAFRLIAR